MTFHTMRILYAGDSNVGGPANYLLGVLASLKAKVLHIPPSRTLTAKEFRRAWDVILLSDFPRKNLNSRAERALEKQVRAGAGLLMVGGWASFSGICGQWKGSIVEGLLPVSCLKRDDRLPFPGGAAIALRQGHSMFEGFSFEDMPALCGINEVRPKKKSSVLLGVKKIIRIGERLALDPVEYPLLIVDSRPQKRAAAFACDFAPHWSGGLVDWGKRRVRLPVTSKIRIEVGDKYVHFISCLVRWLAGRVIPE